MFEDLLKKAIHGKRPEPLQDLLEKAGFKKKIAATDNVGVLGKIAGQANSGGSPKDAANKTNHQLNKETQAVKTVVTGATGPHVKEVHQSTSAPQANTGQHTSSTNVGGGFTAATTAAYGGAQFKSSPPKVTTQPKPEATQPVQSKAKVHPDVANDDELNSFAERFRNGEYDELSPHTLEFMDKVAEKNPETKKILDAWHSNNEQNAEGNAYDPNSEQHQALVNHLHELTGSNPELHQENRNRFKMKRNYADNVRDMMEELDKTYGNKSSKIQKLAEKFWDDMSDDHHIALAEQVKKLYSKWFEKDPSTLPANPLKHYEQADGVEEPEVASTPVPKNIKTKDTPPQVKDYSGMHHYIEDNEMFQKMRDDAKAKGSLAPEDAEGLVEYLATQGDPKAKAVVKELANDENNTTLQAKMLAIAYNALGMDAPNPEAPKSAPKVSEPLLTVPAGEQPKKEIDPALGKPSKLEQQQMGTQMVQHPNGGFVATGHPDGTNPYHIAFTHAGRYYHDNLNVGDTVGYRAWAGTHGLVPFEGKIVDKNPNGHSILHVEHPNRAKREAGEPLPVHYNFITHAWTGNPDNPHEQKRIQYAGEFDKPTKEAEEAGVKPSKQSTPAETAEELERHQKLEKIRGDALKGEIHPKDYVEFYGVDPEDGMTKRLKGIVSRVATPQPKGGAGAAKKGKEGKEGQVADSVVEVNLLHSPHIIPVGNHQILRFGQRRVGKWYYYKFDNKAGAWDDENVVNDHQHNQMIEDSKPKMPEVVHGQAETSAANKLGAQSSDGQATLAAPAAQGPNDGVQHPIEHEELKNVPHDTDEYRHAKTILDAGAKYQGHGSNGKVYFFDPNTKKMHSLPADELTAERVKEVMEGPKAKADEYHKDGFAKQEPQYDIRTHWTHALPEESASEVRSTLDKLDKFREENHVPVSVLAARHQLLNRANHVQALEAMDTINEYLDNPNGHTELRPTKLSKQGEGILHNALTSQNQLNDKDLWNMARALETKNHATPYLKKHQDEMIHEIGDKAAELGLTNIKDAVYGVDSHVDSRQTLEFFNRLLAEKAKDKGANYTPVSINGDDHMRHAQHLDDMTHYLHENGLKNPYIENRIQQLAGLMETDPNNPIVQKMFNQLHEYAYEQGERHPATMLHNLVSFLKNSPAGKKLPPELIEVLEYRNEEVAHGLNPEDALLESIQTLKNAGVNPQEIMQQLPNMNATATRTDAHKQTLDTHLQARKQMAEAADNTKKMQETEAALDPNQQQGPVDSEAQGATIPGSHLTPQAANNIMKKIEEQMNFIKNRELFAQAMKQQGGKHYNKANYNSIMQNLDGEYQQFKKLVGKAKEMGLDVADFEKYTPDFAIPDAGDGGDEFLSDQHMQMENFNRKWMAQEINAARNSIQVQRSHFLQRAARHHDENAAAEVRDVNEQVKDMLESNSWQPLDPSAYISPLAQSFVNAINQHVEDVRNREKLTGVPITAALKMHEEMFGKSIGDAIAAEKTIARRDISLALRKAFYNDKQSPELRKATELMASYFDDFIDAVMNNYTDIPFAVRKSMTRKLLKSLINDVIKDNVYSATMMKQDYTAPLNTTIIKGMGRDVAAAVTKFRMDVYGGDKEFLVVDLNKGMSGRAYPIPDVKPFETVHKKQMLGVKHDQQTWFSLLRSLESDMVKANIIDHVVSEHRLRKFVADNDQKTLESFYNDNVKQLNERLVEINKWAY